MGTRLQCKWTRLDFHLGYFMQAGAIKKQKQGGSLPETSTEQEPGNDKNPNWCIGLLSHFPGFVGVVGCNPGANSVRDVVASFEMLAFEPADRKKICGSAESEIG